MCAFFYFEFIHGEIQKNMSENNSKNIRNNEGKCDKVITNYDRDDYSGDKSPELFSGKFYLLIIKILLYNYLFFDSYFDKGVSEFLLKPKIL